MKQMPQAFTFAQRNGYKGSFYEYLKFNYDLYANGCKRMEIEPLSFDMWQAFVA